MFGNARQAIRVAVTLLILATAAFAGVAVWNHYLTGPWTRDGQVQADIVNLAPEVSGRIVALQVADNQTVHRGDLLYKIDPTDYQIAVAAAEAKIQSKQADLKLRQSEAARRAKLTTLSTSEEEQQSYQSNAQVEVAAYASALTQLNQARIDLERTKVVSPVNGYVTNLLLREGDYATKGARNLSVLDSDSYRIIGYFEETKLLGIHLGDPALAALMSFRDPVRGHVESIARGINTPNTDPGAQGLASVSPVFTWVRLAQRIPVRIHIDTVPDTVQLSAGMTATITVGPGVATTSFHGAISRTMSQVPN